MDTSNIDNYLDSFKELVCEKKRQDSFISDLNIIKSEGLVKSIDPLNQKTKLMVTLI